VSSFWILIGVGVVGFPQIAVRAMAYRDSKAMHQAMIIRTIVVGSIMMGMHLIDVFARAVMPGIEVGDKVMPLLTMEVLPAWLAGIALAAPMTAIMSTVDSILLLVSSAPVKDLYLNYLNPNANERQVKIFIWPIVLGLYWSKGNKYRAISAMMIGMVSYMLIHLFMPNPFGMHIVVLPVLLSFVTYVFISILTTSRSPQTTANRT
jgi:sodium/pantothenate symporter